MLYFSPGYNVPMWGGCRFALTVYDLNHLFIREGSSALIRLYYARILRPALHRAGLIFTSSEFSRQQILEWSGVEDRKLVKIKPGISEAFVPTGDAFLSRRPYLLYVGSHAPHKNLGRTLKAFALSKLAVSHDFLVTGVPSNELQTLVEGLGVADSVRFLGRVPDSTLPPLYRGAVALVFVSLYEGFGMPIVEGMACGTPVLTSNAASMPEAAGGAALLVDPRNIDEIAHGMRKLSEDEGLREELLAKGLKWAARFTWDASAKEVGDALAEIV